MKDQINTIRAALNTCIGLDKALTALSELEAMAGEPVAWKHDCAALLANDVELWIDKCPHCGRPRAAPVSQQPQEPDWKHPKIQALIGADARNRIVIDLIWRILKEPEGGWASAMDMEYWDSIHDAVQSAVMKAQQPQAEAVQHDCFVRDTFCETVEHKCDDCPIQKQPQGEARPCHVFNVTKNGTLTEWEPTTLAFALPDGKHALYTLGGQNSVAKT